jgi:hypothetical protein
LNTLIEKLLLEIESFSFENPANKEIALKIAGNLDISASKLLPAEKLPFFPVEWLKGTDLKYFKGETHKVFLSSGTTQSVRSKSSFSKDGLFLYKVVAIKGFVDNLNKTGIEPNLFQGISLIPKTSEWPDSSLAQMIEWFSEYFQLQYISDSEKTLFIKNIVTTENPTWIFGTAFHAINLLDSFSQTDYDLLSPKENLFFFETGGTKGKTRSLTRKELYNYIHSSLKIPIDNIGSEYGMCELASQAWSFKVENSPLPYESPYKFGSHVETKVTLGRGKLSQSGAGSLVVIDPLRIDLPHPIRVQDIVNLDDNGAFTIQGRVPKSVLKGCSLLAEEVVSNEPSFSGKELSSPKDLKPITIDKTVAKNIYDVFSKLLEKSSFLNSLLYEFGSETVAQSALNDLKLSWHKNFDDFLGSLENAKAFHKSILIIQPNTHSFSSIYPLVFAAANNLKIFIRIPSEKFFALGAVIDSLKEFAEIEVLEKDFRIGSSADKDFDSILAFGSDETIHQISKRSSKHIQAFGNALAITFIKNPSKENIQLAYKDFYSLNQTGCMSSRALFIPLSEKDSFSKALDNLEIEVVTNYINKCALDHEETDLIHKKINYLERKTSSHPLHPIYNLDQDCSWEEILSERTFVLPIVFYNEASDAENFINKLKDLKYISTDDVSYLTNDQFEIRSVGQLNINSWDGTLEKKPLFSND